MDNDYYKKYQNYFLRLDSEKELDRKLIEFLNKGKEELGLNNFLRKVILEYMKVHNNRVDAFVSLEERLQEIELVTIVREKKK